MSKEWIGDHLDIRPPYIRAIQPEPELGKPTLPMSWLKRQYHRWVCKLKQILEIIKE